MIYEQWKYYPGTNNPECNEDSINRKPVAHFHCIEEVVLLHYSVGTFPPGILTKTTRPPILVQRGKQKESVSARLGSYEIYTDAVDFVSRVTLLLTEKSKQQNEIRR